MKGRENMTVKVTTKIPEYWERTVSWEKIHSTNKMEREA